MLVLVGAVAELSAIFNVAELRSCHGFRYSGTLYTHWQAARTRDPDSAGTSVTFVSGGTVRGTENR